MFTNRFKLLIGTILLLGFVSLFTLTLDIFKKEINASLSLSETSLKQSNEALKQIAQFPTLTPTASPTATVRFVPRTPVITKTPVVK